MPVTPIVAPDRGASNTADRIPPAKPNNWPVGPKVETFPITFRDGSRLTATLHQTGARRSGRRIVVRNGDGLVVFDTDEQYDLGNATAVLDLWLADRLDEEGGAL